MKQIFYLIALCALPVVGWGQVHGGLQVGIYDASLVGKFAEPGSRAAYSAGIWSDYSFHSWFGIKADLLYMPRGGRVAEQDFSAEFISLGVTPRFRIDDPTSRVNLLAGVGAFTHFMTGTNDLLNRGDVGPTVELGIEIGRVSLLIHGQAGLLDAVKLLPKSQRWMTVGLALQGRIW